MYAGGRGSKMILRTCVRTLWMLPHASTFTGIKGYTPGFARALLFAIIVGVTVFATRLFCPNVDVDVDIVGCTLEPFCA